MSCGTDVEKLRLLVEKAVRAAIEQGLKDGTLQAGLKGCDGERLDRNMQVVKCGEITIPKDVHLSHAELANNELRLRLNDDAQTEFKVPLPFKDDVHVERAELVDKQLRIHMNDAARTVHAVDLPLTADTHLTRAELVGKQLRLHLNDQAATVLTVDLPLVEDTHLPHAEIADGELRLRLNDDAQTEFKVPLPVAKDTHIESGRIDAAAKELVLTKNDQTEVKIDLCGWRGAQPCRYHATLQVALGGDECGMFRRVAWAFHPDDLRDPAATVRLADCDDATIGWIYPTAGSNHTIELTSSKGEPIGFGLSSPVVEVWSDECCKSN